ncbi:MAG: phospholipid carrier-dependent glycosyltransferase [Pseudomonadota bacterium]|nr:phospholipid carrier-dependent glycosyltransferase [Pseudomonadota bacterium]
MQRTQSGERDPLAWCAALSLIFAAMAFYHLGIPGKMYFDEVHYVPAARALLGARLANAEHPLLAKEAIAAAIRLCGDHPLSWRLPSAVMGTVGLFAFGRALWWASQRRFATLAGMVLLATDFAWFIQSRIAMLDMTMAGLAMVALWQVAAAVRCPNRARAHLALAGLAFGLAMGAKWSAAPVIACVVIALAAVRIRAAFASRAKAGIAATNTAPIPGITLSEMLFWLLSVPIFVYWLTFVPAFLYCHYPIDPAAFLAWQRYMVQLQESVLTRHPYQSVWYQWIVNWRAVWYLYERVDGAQRGIVLIGNPFTMLAGLPALLWCAVTGWRKCWARLGRERLAIAGLYLACLAMWVFAPKPVQFYYHYLLAGTTLIAALALALDALWRRRDAWRWTAPAALALSVGSFGYFYPIIAAAPLYHGTASFEQWMWLASWR